MNWLYPIAFVLLISETSGFAPTTVVQVPHDVHEWFTESLHEAEVGDIKVSSVDDSWIGQEFHSVSPESFSYFGQRRHHVTLESPPVAGGNEWMTHALQWGDVSGPTAVHALAPGVVGLSRAAGRSDGFVDKIPATHHHYKAGTTLVGLPTGRSDGFSTAASIATKPSITTQADHDTQSSLSRASFGATRQGSGDWFHQALQLVDQ